MALASLLQTGHADVTRQLANTRAPRPNCGKRCEIETALPGQRRVGGYRDVGDARAGRFSEPSVLRKLLFKHVDGGHGTVCG